MSSAERNEHLLSLLDRTIPFRFLDREQQHSLLPDLRQERYAEGEVIVRFGDRDDTVYLLDEGSVETMNMVHVPPFRLNLIAPGHYFGERSALFAQPRVNEIRAVEPVRCFAMTGERFLRLLRESRPFAHALGTILRDKHGIFAAFDHFTAELVRGAARGHIDIPELLPRYQELEPALHPFAEDMGRIDLSAFAYAIRRLPENVTRTFGYLLTDDLPGIYSSPDLLFRKVATSARRRDVWEMLPGKSMVLLRNGLSDLMDLVTCLCLYAVEARKLRYRINESGMLLAIDRFIAGRSGPEETDSEEEPPEAGPSEAGGTPGETAARNPEREFLLTLPFTPEEVNGIMNVWPRDPVARLRDITRHREVFHIDVRRQTQNYNSRSSEFWTDQIGKATMRVLGYAPNRLPEGTRVHIISSNSHSVANCLNPYLIEREQEIAEWGRRRGLADTAWHNPYDSLYAAAREYLAARPEVLADMRRQEEDWGIFRLKETASTGIQVQLIDVSRLAGRPIDPGITPPPADERILLVNIDYAFGEQAEEIIRNLLLLFGRNVASINVLGKAGALLGRRGDVLVPTAFVEQFSDQFLPLPQPSECCGRLEGRIPDHTVHRGPLLTVAGTLLQNRMMLHFYRSIWECIGLEMEGAFYYRQIQKSIQTGLIDGNVILRFFYYVSDLPLDHDGSLSRRLGMSEGIPPLYAITREILSEMFEQERRG